MAMPGSGSGSGSRDGAAGDDETRGLLLNSSRRSSAASVEATKLRPASSWSSAASTGSSEPRSQPQQKLLPTNASTSSSFRTYRCVCLLLAGIVALSVLDFMGVWRQGSDTKGGEGTVVGRPNNRFGGFRGGITNKKKNVTSTDTQTSIVAIVDADNEGNAEENTEELANLTLSSSASGSASSSSSADNNKEEEEEDDPNEDDDADGDDDDDDNADEDNPDGETQAEENEEEEGDDYEKDGDDDEDEGDEEDGDDDTDEDNTDGDGSDAEDRTIPPAPAHLLYNQTFSNWTVLLSEIPVSPSKFLNEVPQGMRIAFVGDSVMRYQAMSFMYFLLHQGEWFPDDGSIHPDLVAKNDVDHGKSWNSFFNVSSYQLGQETGNHWCDCYRGVTQANKIFENRYFRDLVNDNYVYFITKLGPSASRGRWWPSTISQWKKPRSFDSKDGKAKWSYQWDSLIRRHLALLEPKPTHVVFNEGLWAGLNNYTYKIIQQALNDTNMTGIYKTTTKRSREQTPELKDFDAAGCEMFECLNLSWSYVLVMWPYYFDYGTHFTSQVYTLFNQQLLKILKDLGAFQSSLPAP